MILSIKAAREALGAIVASARPRAGIGILFGDVNFVNRNGTRWEQLLAGPSIMPHTNHTTGGPRNAGPPPSTP